MESLNGVLLPIILFSPLVAALLALIFGTNERVIGLEHLFDGSL